ncbi:MAG: zf-HC2 domain-containing protein [Candidatus Omnitrophica bacterium]|nr:zf-HC2 domain-containing protein [Candidatus Omnitrophota bacterium]
MDHQSIKEKLLSYKDPELSTAEREQITLHLTSCEDCRSAFARWEAVRSKFKALPSARSSEAFVNQVMARLDALEKVEPTIVVSEQRPFLRWLLPLTGYAFAFFLMILAITHQEQQVNTDAVLLADVPQASQWTFSMETPDTSRLLGIQKEEI